MSAIDLEIVRISDRPDLAPVVATWLWEEFWKHLGYSFEHTCGIVSGRISLIGSSQTFVLLAAGSPIGTASLVADDLSERRDLTPWLADVFVIPEARGWGYVTRLIAAVEDAGRKASISTMWLHTNTAERIYTKQGWELVEYFEHRGKRTALMRRSLLSP